MSVIWKQYQVFHHQRAGTEIHNGCARAVICSAFCSPAMILLHSNMSLWKASCFIYIKKIQRICFPPSLLCLVALWADSCYVWQNPCKPHLLPRQLLLHVTTWKMWSSLRVAWVFIVDVWRLTRLPLAALYSPWQLLRVLPRMHANATVLVWRCPADGFVKQCVAQTAEQMVQW